jgi:hypothetical protein
MPDTGGFRFTAIKNVTIQNYSNLFKRIAIRQLAVWMVEANRESEGALLLGVITERNVTVTFLVRVRLQYPKFL